MTRSAFRRLALSAAWCVSIGAALGAGAFGHKYRAQIRALVSSVQGSPAITTNLYTLRVEKLAIETEGRDGGIVAFRDGLLLASRSGTLWFVDMAAKTLQPLVPRIPINLDEFNADEFNATTSYPELFAVKDIALQQITNGVRLIASHSHWYPEKQCNTVRVSTLETTESALLADHGAPPEWRTLYETTPCRPLERSGEGQRMGLGSGGRIAPLPDGAVLVTFGGLDPENELVLQAPQDLGNSYGKTVWIDPASGASRVFTIGHRNPQGLATSSDGQIWLTEHGARGGDELNNLREGGNYGYPRVAYGTQYESMTWPLSSAQGRHDGYDKPMFAWTPSIGISQLIVLQGTKFPYWRGDLIVSSLGAQTLFRVRVEDGRAILVEPISIGHRVRDIVETADGSIVLKTDDDFLVFLTPLDAATAATPLERGTVLAATCQACHSLTPNGANAIGPALWGVVDRPVAAVEGFTYSPALRALGGRWTPDRLAGFLENPNAFVPGTTMQLVNTSYDESQVADLIAYLQTLR